MAYTENLGQIYSQNYKIDSVSGWPKAIAHYEQAADYYKGEESNR